MSLEEVVTIVITKKKLQQMKLDAADISCWFMGFKAACKDDVELPPGLKSFEDEFNALIRNSGL